MLDLYHANHSTCSQKVRLCMAEKGLEYESHLINLATKEQLDPDYLRINPNGVVPSLVHDGLVVIDSSVICEYLDETTPMTAPECANGCVISRKFRPPPCVFRPSTWHFCRGSTGSTRKASCRNRPTCGR